MTPLVGSSPRNNLAVILVNPAAFGPMLIARVLPYMGIRPARIVVIRPVVGIPDRGVIASVGLWIHHTKCGSRPDEIPVKRLVYINPVIWIDISDMVVVVAESIVIDTHTTKAVKPATPIVHVNIPNSADPSVVIIEDRKLCDLYDGSVVVILHIRIVIET